MTLISKKYTTLFLKINLIVCIQVLCVQFFAQKTEVKLLKIGKSGENVFASDYFDNSLFYCSDKKIKSQKGSINEYNLNFLDLYSIAVNLDKFQLGESLNLGESINTSLNEGPIDFNDLNKKGYFSSNITDTSTTELYLGLFETIQIAPNQYEKRKIIFTESQTFNVAHPTISEDGTMLVYSSDMSISKGQTDLFFSIFSDGKWSKPTPMENVNTIAIETFPHFYGNTLYFASDREGGLGGLDIYSSTRTGGSFSDPKLLEAPINSEFDDFLFIPVNETSGFLSSNRNEFDRIFSYRIDLPQPSSFDEINDNFCFELMDEGRLDTTRFQHEWILGDGTKKNGINVSHCYADTGVYLVECNLIDFKNDEIDKAFISTEIEINITKPTIQYAIENGKINLWVDQKYSPIKYTEYYWIINNVIIREQKPNLIFDSEKMLQIKLVLWEEKKESNSIGILKKLTLK